MNRICRALAICLILGVFLTGCGQQPPFGPAPSPAMAQAGGSEASQVAPSASGPAGSSPAASPTRPALPARLVIPSIGVDAAVEAVAETADGAMAAPRRWEDVGWFSPGFRPGEAGSAVIAGHLDSTTAPAVFWHLSQIAANDQVQVILADGSRETFVVTGKQTYKANQAPLDRIFGGGNLARLNLVTCDGAWDGSAQQYDSRLVVYTREAGEGASIGPAAAI